MGFMSTKALFFARGLCDSCCQRNSNPEALDDSPLFVLKFTQIDDLERTVQQRARDVSQRRVLSQPRHAQSTGFVFGFKAAYDHLWTCESRLSASESGLILGQRKQQVVVKQKEDLELRTETAYCGFRRTPCAKARSPNL